MKETRVRIAKKSEPYIDGTMISLGRNEIVLKEKKTLKGRKIEDIIGEVLSHEIIHVVVYKITKDEIIAASIDDITAWTKTYYGWKYVFFSKKTGKIFLQSP